MATLVAKVLAKVRYYIKVITEEFLRVLDPFEFNHNFASTLTVEFYSYYYNSSRSTVLDVLATISSLRRENK